jgi:hypothetical protein
MCYHKTQTPKGNTPVYANREEDKHLYRREKKNPKFQNCCFSKRLMLQDLFFKGGEGKETEKSKYVYNIFSSF